MASQIKEGLEGFCQLWNVLAPIISASERAIAPALFHKRINCRVRDGASYVMAIAPDRATVEEGEDAWAHTTIEMDEADWLRSMNGECNIRSISMAGRFACDIEQLKVVSVFGMILQSFSLLRQG